MNDTPTNLRSTGWFAKTDKNGFIHRSWMKNQGHPHHMFDGRPGIGICNIWSEPECRADLDFLVGASEARVTRDSH